MKYTTPIIAVMVTNMPMIMAAHTHIPELVVCEMAAVAVGVIEILEAAVTVGAEVAYFSATMVGVGLGVGVTVG